MEHCGASAVLGSPWRYQQINELIPFGPRSSTILVGADVHIKYKSKDSFGAVLIAQKPITIASYYNETHFQSWLGANKAFLSSSHGPQL